MHPTLRHALREVTNCPRHVDCPGIREGILHRVPNEGIYSRGFFVRPSDVAPKDIDLVILGLNPGPGGAFERAFYSEVSRRPLTNNILLRLNNVMAENQDDSPYWRRINQLLDALWPNGSSKPMLAAELAYCESTLRKNGGLKAPNNNTITHCTSQHLSHQLHALRPGTHLVCVGTQARDWATKTGGLAHFRWFWIYHPSAQREWPANTAGLRPQAHKLWHARQRGPWGFHLSAAPV